MRPTISAWTVWLARRQSAWVCLLHCGGDDFWSTCTRCWRGLGARSQAHCARRVTAGSLWAVGGVLCAGTFCRGVKHRLHGRCVGARLLGVQHGIIVSPTTCQSFAGGEDFVTDGDRLRQRGVGAALQAAEKRGP
ncbi:hypothetical protein TcCL_Unassigned00173 [Trypanosoma cruzi]|nr:hypothetical protein TcCL_Unassigned00173 [Trypanosoma cruzi]